MIFTFIALILATTFLLLVFVYAKKTRKLKGFVSLHSIALKSLRQLNTEAHYFPVHPLKERHVYDNEKCMTKYLARTI